MNEKILAIWLSKALGPGSIYAKRLLEEYGSFENIYRLSPLEYEHIGIKRNSTLMTRLSDKNTDHAYKSAAFCDQNHFGIVEYTSHLYPQRLRVIKDPPPVLFTRGRMIDIDDNVCLAVVGTRSYSDAGWNSTYKIASGLASGGAVVVTGLASGIDTAATRAALDSSGFAIGVIGSGIEKIYPLENKELFEEMYQKGLVITERVPFAEITGSYFPVRNRIISGISNAVLVGEGSTKSGAMITAGHASEQGRHIYAIPADISNPESTGVNNLIRDGAYPVFDSWDILKNYTYLYPHRITGISASQITEVPEKRSTKRIRVIKGSSSVADGKVQPSTEHQSTISKESAIAKKKEDEIHKQHNANSKAKIAMPDFGLDSLNPTERKIYDCIASNGSMVADTISEQTGIHPIDVNIALTILEMSGLVETEGAKVRIKQ